MNISKNCSFINFGAFRQIIIYSEVWLKQFFFYFKIFNISVNICEKYDPCLNGGMCGNICGGYICKCTVGWEGENCEKGKCKHIVYINVNQIKPDCQYRLYFIRKLLVKSEGNISKLKCTIMETTASISMIFCKGAIFF